MTPAARQLEMSSLVLSVAVEGIVGLLQGKGLADKDLVRDVETALEVATGAEFPASLKQRILGSIGAMKQLRAQDYLKPLVKAGVIPIGHVDAWQRLRHSSAHADAYEGDWIGPTVRRSSVVLALYYRLVFMLIGYRGPYTDYSQIGWPAAEIESA